MRSKIIFYPFVLKAIMVFLTILLTVDVALMLTPRTDMSEVAKYTVVGIVWLVILYVTSRRFRTIAEGHDSFSLPRLGVCDIFCRDGDMDSRRKRPASQQSAARDGVCHVWWLVCYERAAAADAPAVRCGKVAGLGH